MERRNNYIKPATIETTYKIIYQMSNCICKVNNSQSIGTGFFCTIPYKNNTKINVLITSYQIINEFYIHNNVIINLLLGDYNESKIINLNPSRYIYFSQEYNITIIELKDYDNINNFIELDDNIFRNDIKSLYENESIYILQYLNGGKALVSYGIINKLNGKFINHLCGIESGAIGAPILNLTNNKIIGISSEYNNNFNNFKVGIVLKYAIGEFINKYQIYNQQMANMLNNNFQIIGMNNNFNNFLMPNNMINNNNNCVMPSKMINNAPFNMMKLNQIHNFIPDKNTPKICVIFSKPNDIEITLNVNYGITIEQLLILYLKRINKEDLIGNSKDIIYIYNAKKINIKDQTRIEVYFEGTFHPKISVINVSGLKGGPTYLVTFTTTGGHTIKLSVDDYSTVKRVLVEYLLKINKLELIIDNTNKICFLYKGNKIKTDDMNKDVCQFFTSDYEQNIVVNDPNNLIGN